MTARYRCCFCGSRSFPYAKDCRDHMVKRHRGVLETLLHPLTVFTPREEVERPVRPLRRRPVPNSGVTGEGDSSAGYFDKEEC